MRHLLFAALLVGCAGAEDEEVEVDPSDADGSVAEPETGAADSPSATSSVRVAQLNPYYAGRLAPVNLSAPSCERTTDCSSSCTSKAQTDCFECIDRRCRQRTYETAETAADLFAAIRADVVGIQELDPAFAPKIDAIFEAATGGAWDYKVTAQGINGVGSGVGVYWRSSRVELVADLGAIDVGTLSTGYKVRFQGVLLKAKSTGKTFGFFSGKLDWNKDAGAIREAQAKVLRREIDLRMQPYETAGSRPRIVATDLNDTVGSRAYNVFANYDDGDARKATSSTGPSPTRRIDYLFWADKSTGASSNGFVGARSDGRLGRSMFFGSDHRFVYGDARIP